MSEATVLKCRRWVVPLVLALVLMAACAVFLPGIGWGLPSKAVDPYLFGDQPVWTGEKIASLAPTDAEVLGADVDANPITDRSRPLTLNQTDTQRAEIIRRYRLFSYQPDEMITLKSLARIKQHHGDPRLYQYGGLWIYPIGALLKATSIIGLIDLRGGADGQIFYLDHPEAFGRFYIVMRAYCVAWGLVAVWAVFWILRRLTANHLIAALGAICFAFMPVVVTMAHEAKPHLPGLALTLLAVIAATKYLETNKSKWAILAGAFCGGALGMVLSGLLSLAILPMMVFLRRGLLRDRIQMLVLSTCTALVTYVIPNPFVPINALTNPQALRANLGNSTAMYRISLGGFNNAIRLIIEGVSPALAMAGVVGLVVLLIQRLRRRTNSDPSTKSDAILLLAAPALLVALQFILLAQSKPPEYARFALTLDALLAIAAFTWIGQIAAHKSRAALAIMLTFVTLTFGGAYVLAFTRDSGTKTSRLITAASIQSLSLETRQTIGISAEPAPYIMPPVDLFSRQLILTPAPVATIAVESSSKVRVSLDPSNSLTPISWADVRFILDYTRPIERKKLSSPP